MVYSFFLQFFSCHGFYNVRPSAMPKVERIEFILACAPSTVGWLALPVECRNQDQTANRESHAKCTHVDSSLNSSTRFVRLPLFRSTPFEVRLDHFYISRSSFVSSRSRTSLFGHRFEQFLPQSRLPFAIFLLRRNDAL